MKKLFFVLILLFTSGCTKTPVTENEVKFNYSSLDFTNTYGLAINNEQYEDIIINPVSNLRNDFINGVDASMVLTVEENGGKYFNNEGKEQDVFQIMANNGVNFFRVRIWNHPFDKYGDGYGGGDVGVDRAITMAKRAKAAGMNIFLDLHYSDFWADPDSQSLPREWANKTSDELVTTVEDFTIKTMNRFKNAGVTVEMVQIGNEINNGMLFNEGKIDWNNEGKSFDYLCKLLKAGIKGAKKVYPNIYTVIHLANGGNYDEFDAFFSHLKTRNVDYDIIGASYYSYYHGTLKALQNNLDKISEKYNKPIIICETSYGFTDEYNEYSNNTYSSSFEDTGGYKTSIQGQATALRDVIQVLAKIPKQKGLGVFYWEPGWLPVAKASWANAVSGRTETDGKATWSNQALFSYTGKALPSLQTFSLVKTSTSNLSEVAQKTRTNTINLTLNLAANEKMPTTYKVETNFDAIREQSVVWDEQDLAKLNKVGIYSVKGKVVNKFDVISNVNVIENYIVDPGYELQGATDAIIAPWIVAMQTPINEKVVKLDRKSDTRSGTTDLNWYHSSKDISFKVIQTITNLPQGTYELTTYCMAISKNEIAHTVLYIYITHDGQTQQYDLKDKVIGWGSKDTYYIKAFIDNIEINSSQAEIGIVVEAPKQAWGHLDDWSLIKK